MTMLKLLLACVIAVTIFSTTAAFAQVSMGGPPNEDIKVRLDENGAAHVVHAVQGNATSPIHVEMIAGNLANLTVTDQFNNSVQYSTISQSPMSILLLPTQRNVTLIKYDIPNALTDNNGLWSWNYYAPSDAVFTDFYFPKGVDMIWSQDRPVYLGDKAGLRQIGNGMHLAYTINEPETIQTVQWQNQTFNVGVRSLANIGPPVFDQSSKAYAFNVDKANSYVTVIMPKALLWGPYQATINTNQTLTNQFNDNGTHVWIGMKPSHNGTLQITGTTAIPEFPMFVPLAIAISAVVALRFSNRLNFN
ncbi:hypothetical protein DYY67_1807 [Candidatus Nitrosotalea sp. TS]|nr:hypothetical protein [Candidatus Nitrosotalea sp. TS]